MDNKYVKELMSFMALVVTVKNKRNHSRKMRDIMQTKVFGGYERINDTQFYIHTKIGKS